MDRAEELARSVVGIAFFEAATGHKNPVLDDMTATYAQALRDYRDEGLEEAAELADARSREALEQSPGPAFAAGVLASFAETLRALKSGQGEKA